MLRLCGMLSHLSSMARARVYACTSLNFPLCAHNLRKVVTKSLLWVFYFKHVDTGEQFLET
jgi:hypothetical protein